MKKILETRYGTLIFSLLAGCAYFGVIMNFILENAGKKGILLGFFFFPAIICGAALMLFKSIKRLQEEENYSKITVIFVCHVILAVIAAVMLLARL